MKGIRKFAIATIITMSFLSLTAPMPHVEACSGSNQSLMHFFSKGHSGGAHFTTYQVKSSSATAEILVLNVGGQIKTAHNGTVATARVTAASNAVHSHHTSVK